MQASLIQASLIDALIYPVMVGAAVMAVLWPLSRARYVTPSGQLDVDFYRQRLAEIDEDLARGLIRDHEADAARTEAARRILALKTEDAAAQAPSTGASPRGKAAVLALVLIPLLSLGLYGLWGAPGLPDLPFSERPKIPVANNASGMAGVLAKIENHLATNPDDVQGWELVAPIYMAVGRFDDAVKAYTALLKAKPKAAASYEALGEALVAQADGVVTAEAAAQFANALTIDPALRGARFYSALALEQDGKVDEAIAAYQGLLGELGADSEAAQTVRQRLESLQKGRVK